jgi:hypothetical protein
MTDPAHPAEPAAAGHAPAPPAGPLFPADEWQQFCTIDKVAAGYIVGLMAGIFSVGLVLYLIVLWSVTS